MINKSGKTILGIEIVNTHLVEENTLARYQENDVSCIEIFIEAKQFDNWEKDILAKRSIKFASSDFNIKYISNMDLKQFRILRNLDSNELDFSVIKDKTYAWNLCDKFTRVREFFIPSLVSNKASQSSNRSKCRLKSQDKCEGCKFYWGTHEDIDRLSEIQYCIDPNNIDKNDSPKVVAHFWSDGGVNTQILSNSSLLSVEIPKNTTFVDFHKFTKFSAKEREKIGSDHFSLGLHQSCSYSIINFSDFYTEEDHFVRLLSLRKFSRDVVFKSNGKSKKIRIKSTQKQDVILQEIARSLIPNLVARFNDITHGCLPKIKAANPLTSAIYPDSIPGYRKINGWLVFSSTFDPVKYSLLEAVEELRNQYPRIKYDEIIYRINYIENEIRILAEIASGPPKNSTMEEFFDQINNLNLLFEKDSPQTYDPSLQVDPIINQTKWRSSIFNYANYILSIGFDNSRLSNFISQIDELIEKVFTLPAKSLLFDFDKALNDRDDIANLHDLLRILSNDQQRLSDRFPNAVEFLSEASNKIRFEVLEKQIKIVNSRFTKLEATYESIDQETDKTEIGTSIIRCDHLYRDILKLDNSFDASHLTDQIRKLKFNFVDQYGPSFESKMRLLHDNPSDQDRAVLVDNSIRLILVEKLGNDCWINALVNELSKYQISEGEMYKSLKRLEKNLNITYSDDFSRISFNIEHSSNGE